MSADLDTLLADAKALVGSDPRNRTMQANPHLIIAILDRLARAEAAIPADPFVAEVEYKSWCYACGARGAYPKDPVAQPHRPDCTWWLAMGKPDA